MAARTPAKRPGKRPGKTPSQAVRERRDRLILDLFLTGKKPQEIASHPQVKLTARRVQDIVNTELENCTRDQIVLSEKAMTIYLARLEILVQEAFSHVQDGDLKAIEVCRRLLDQQQKVFGLADERVSPMSIPPMSDNEIATEVDDAGDPMDELAQYRAQRKDAQGN